MDCFVYPTDTRNAKVVSGWTSKVLISGFTETDHLSGIHRDTVRVIQAICWRVASEAGRDEASAELENSSASLSMGLHFRAQMSRR